MNPFLDIGDVIPARRTWGQRLMLLFNTALIALSLVVAMVLGYASDRAASINRVALDRSLTELPSVDRGERVLNILLVGSDSSANLDPDDPIQVGRQGERLGDVIIIAHLDERDGTVALLSLPRDLWVPIAGSTRENRINRAFLVGGPATLIETIEENFDIPIHHYVNVDFAGFQGLVDAVGSVDIFFDTPARDWNANASPAPRSQTGFVVETAGCHALGPEQALAYVRSRYYQTQNEDGRWVTDPTSDLGRIRRQQEFLQRLLQQAIDLGARNPLVLTDLIDTGVQNVAIDHELTPSLLIDVSATFRSFEPGDLQTFTFPAADETVGSNRVLIPLVDRAQPLIELFNGESVNSPTTIGLRVIHDPELGGGAEGPTRLPSGVEAVIDQLEDAGFDVSSVDTGSVGEGLRVRHGSDGRQAAEVVAAMLANGSWGDKIVFEESGGLTGRNVVVAVGTGVTGATGSTAAIVGPTLVAPDNAITQSDGSSTSITSADGSSAQTTTGPARNVDAESAGETPSGPFGPTDDQTELGSGVVEHAECR